MENDILPSDSSLNGSQSQETGDRNFKSKIKKASKIKAFIKKQRYWFAGSVVILLIAVVVLASGGPKTSYTTTEIVRGDLVQTVEASGELESLKDVDLSFQTSGVVSHIYANVGEEVTAGDLVLTLVSDEALADLTQAQESVNRAQAVIDQLYAGASNEEIAIAQASLTIAKIDLESTKTNGDNTIATALLNYQTAQDTYDNLVAQNAESLDQIYADMISIMRANVIEIRGALSDADEILGVENTLANNDFEIYLSANDPQVFSSAKKYYGYAAEGRDFAEDAVYAIDETYSFDDVLTVADTVAGALNNTAMAFYYTRAVLDATVVDTAVLTQADITAFKASVDAVRAAIQTDEDTLTGQMQLLNTTTLSASTSELSSLNSLSSAKLVYENSQSTNTATISMKEAALASAQANYDSVTADVRGVDSAAYFADLGLARAQLDAASARFQKTEIRSPINGVVTNIALDEGELATAGMSIATVQTLDEAYKITLAVSESDIVKVTQGDKASVTFDAYGDDLVVEAYVGAIDPAETNIEGVVYYNVDVYISDTRSIALKPGMSADVIIMIDEREGALYISQRAILENNEGKYVRILIGDTFEERQILTGLRADGGLIEIIEGVEESEIVVVSIQE